MHNTVFCHNWWAAVAGKPYVCESTFLPRDAMLAWYAVIVCVSVRLFVCPSESEVKSRSASDNSPLKLIAKNLRYQDVCSFPAWNCQLADRIVLFVMTVTVVNSIWLQRKANIFPQKVKIREPECKFCRQTFNNVTVTAEICVLNVFCSRHDRKRVRPTSWFRMHVANRSSFSESRQRVNEYASGDWPISTDADLRPHVAPYSTNGASRSSVTFVLGLPLGNSISQWLADSSDFGFIGEQSFPKWEIIVIADSWRIIV